MSEIAAEVPKKPSLIARIKERFAHMKERSAQVKKGAEQAKATEASLSLDEKLKQRIAKIVTTEPKLSLDARVEAEWLASYQRIYQALGEGKVKQAMEKLAPVFAVHAKVARGLSHGIDLGLRGFAILSFGRGLINVGAGMSEGGGFRQAYYAHDAADDFRRAAVAGTMNVEGLSLLSAKAQGFVGEKVVKIVDKILHKPQKI